MGGLYQARSLPRGLERGWGLRCTKPIVDGQFVVEVLGRCLSEEEHSYLEDPTYAVGFPNNVILAKHGLGDELHYIDPKMCGSMMRFVNDSQEAPNCQLVYWPPFDAAKGIMPRRAFLVAQHDIPAMVELTFDYGKHYTRTWVTASEEQQPAAADVPAAMDEPLSAAALSGAVAAEPSALTMAASEQEAPLALNARLNAAEADEAALAAPVADNK